ncbi:hypothetical protein C4D60_Mb06t27820 [Musa balbisiana]|uniref:Uncharacterized protein n=1 Tax=Musa balbisiana TaxID=52838 RepID=A0A4S8ISF4_MUSBA|nr:hypothetical protein C4D60_Mb06t27820 [Musa balbisiana]
MTLATCSTPSGSEAQFWRTFHFQSTFSLLVHDRALSDHDYFGPCLLFPNPATSLQFDGQLGQKCSNDQTVAHIITEQKINIWYHTVMIPIGAPKAPGGSGSNSTPRPGPSCRSGSPSCASTDASIRSSAMVRRLRWVGGGGNTGS